jgi:hypothetical protein
MVAQAIKGAYYDGKDYATKRLASQADTPQSLLTCAKEYLAFEQDTKGKRFWRGVRFVAQKGMAQ